MILPKAIQAQTQHILLISLFILGALVVTFPAFAEDLVINEIMSENHATIDDEDGDSSDWIEIKNNGSNPVSLSRYWVYLTQGNKTVKSQLGAVQVPAQGYVVLWASQKKGKANHLSFKLDNTKFASVTLRDNALNVVDDVSLGPMGQDESWGNRPDGVKGEWMYLGQSAATPKASNDVQMSSQEVIINEVMLSGDGDWIEFYNPTDHDMDLGGAFLSDDGDRLRKWVFPNKSIIPKKGYLLVLSSEFPTEKLINNESPYVKADFGIKNDGTEGIYFTSRDGHYADKIEAKFFKGIISGQSIGLSPKEDKHYVLFENPTPGLNNEGQIILSPVQFSTKGGVYEGKVTLTLSTLEEGAQIQTTIFRGRNAIGKYAVSSGIYTQPIQIDRSMTVWAYAKKEGYANSVLTGQTFIIGEKTYHVPVVSVSTMPENLDDPIKGLWGKGLNGVTPNEQIDIENPGYVEWINENGENQWGQAVGLKLSGNSSRSLNPKPMAFVARSKYRANGRIPNIFFTKNTAASFNGLVLRNGSQDGAALNINRKARGTFIRNQVMADLCRQLHLPFRDSRSVLFYLNGEFWALANLQENFNENYILDHDQTLQKENIDLIKIVNQRVHEISLRRDNEIITRPFGDQSFIEYEYKSQEGKGIEDYIQLIQYIKSNQDRINDKEVVERISSELDLSNVIDYYIAQIYSGDTDWPNNNVRLWRNTQLSQDRRWQYIYADSDYTFNLDDKAQSNNTLELALANTELSALLKNNMFKQAFIDRLQETLNTVFAKEKVLELIDVYAAEIEPLIDQHAAKNGQGLLTKGQWRENVSQLRKFVTNRQEQINAWVQTLLKISLQKAIILNENGVKNASHAISSEIAQLSELPTADSKDASLANKPSVKAKLNNINGFFNPYQQKIDWQNNLGENLIEYGFEISDKPIKERFSSANYALLPLAITNQQIPPNLRHLNRLYVTLWSHRQDNGEWLRDDQIIDIKRPLLPADQNPRANLKSGIYANPQVLILTPSSLQDRIYYTINGEEKVYLYDQPIHINKTSMIQFKSMGLGGQSTTQSVHLIINPKLNQRPVFSFISKDLKEDMRLDQHVSNYQASVAGFGVGNDQENVDEVDLELSQDKNKGLYISIPMFSKLNEVLSSANDTKNPSTRSNIILNKLFLLFKPLSQSGLDFIEHAVFSAITSRLGLSDEKVILGDVYINGVYKGVYEISTQEKPLSEMMNKNKQVSMDDQALRVRKLIKQIRERENVFDLNLVSPEVIRNSADVLLLDLLWQRQGEGAVSLFNWNELKGKWEIQFMRQMDENRKGRFALSLDTIGWFKNNEVLNEKDFKILFLNRAANLILERLNTQNLQDIFDEIRKQFALNDEDLIKNEQTKIWLDNLRKVQAWLSRAQIDMRNDLINHFKLNGFAQVSIENLSRSIQSTYLLNGEEVKQASVLRTFFIGIPIYLEAKPSLGERFKFWLVNNQLLNKRSIQLNSKDDIEIKIHWLGDKNDMAL